MTKIPFKARLSQAHQLFILTLRWIFSLPIDAVREQHRKDLDEQVSQTLQNMAGIIHQLNARLSWYEKRVPLIRKEYAAFCAKQRKLAAAKAKRELAADPIAEMSVSEDGG